MPDDSDFPRLVALACHDLRTPLATVNGFAKTLLRAESLGERDARFVEMIDAAAEQMAELLDAVSLATRISSGRYDPALQEADTLDLATSGRPTIAAKGEGETIETDVTAVSRALAGLATAAVRHGGIDSVTWTVRGRALTLAPVNPAAAPVVTGAEPKDLGSLVAHLVIEHLGGSLTLDGETLRVTI